MEGTEGKGFQMLPSVATYGQFAQV
jgi:hypothetical protein